MPKKEPGRTTRPIGNIFKITNIRIAIPKNVKNSSSVIKKQKITAKPRKMGRIGIETKKVVMSKMKPITINGTKINALTFPKLDFGGVKTLIESFRKTRIPSPIRINIPNPIKEKTDPKRIRNTKHIPKIIKDALKVESDSVSVHS
jgi:hypothetical protein